jgi:hypothetical protein
MSANISWTPDGTLGSPVLLADGTPQWWHEAPSRRHSYGLAGPAATGSTVPAALPAGRAQVGHAMPSAFNLPSPNGGWRSAPGMRAAAVRRLPGVPNFPMPLATVDSGDAPSLISQTQDASFMSGARADADAGNGSAVDGASSRVPGSHPIASGMSFMSNPTQGDASFMSSPGGGSARRKPRAGHSGLEGASYQLSTLDSYTCLPLPPPAGDNALDTAFCVPPTAANGFARAQPPAERDWAPLVAALVPSSDPNSPAALHGKQASLASSIGPTVTLDPAAVQSASADIANSVTACISGVGTSVPPPAIVGPAATSVTDLSPLLEASMEAMPDDTGSLSVRCSRDPAQASAC